MTRPNSDGHRGRTGAPGEDRIAAPAIELVAAGRRIIVELAGRERLALAGVGWATVELGRAEQQLASALGPDLAEGFGPAPDDELMGAYCRVARLAGGLALVLLEPNTEGRLAAALARSGEAIVVAYVTAPASRQHGRGLAGARNDGHQRPIDGPLGPARHVAGGRRGPHLVEVLAPPGGMPLPGGATIAR